MQDELTPEQEAQVTVVKETAPSAEEAEEQLEEAVEGTVEEAVEGTAEIVGEVEPEDVDETPDISGDEDYSKRVRKELFRLREKRREAESRAAYAEGQLAAKKEETPPVKEVAPDTADMPKEDDYETYEDYIDAKTDWKVDQRVAKMEAQKAEDDEKKRLDDGEQVFKTKLAEGEERYDDFQEVAMNPAIPISVVMADILSTTENPADIAYHLGKNINEAVAISKMTPVQAARAIGKLETKLAAEFKDNPPKATKQVTKAPPAVKPTIGAGNVISKDPDKMSFEEYKEWRQKGGGR